MLLALEAWPADLFTREASVSFFITIVALNVVWITIKIILWSHGYRGWFDSKDMRQLKELAQSRHDSTAGSVYSILRYSWISLFTLLFVHPFALLGVSYLTRRLH